MLETIGAASLDALVGETVPDAIRMEGTLDIGPERGEAETLAELHAIAEPQRSCVARTSAWATPGRSRPA